ncbi:MAG: acetate--CoA ligase family protein [Bacillota bacterium]
MIPLTSAIHGRRSEPPAAFRDTDRAAARAGLDRAAPGSFQESFSVLESYGIPVTPWKVVARKGEAIEAARELGFPVALKGLGPGLVHKSEAGVIRLGLETASAVGKAFVEVVKAVRQATGDADGALVQKCLTGGHEVILGAKRDPAFLVAERTRTSARLTSTRSSSSRRDRAAGPSTPGSGSDRRLSVLEHLDELVPVPRWSRC